MSPLKSSQFAGRGGIVHCSGQPKICDLEGHLIAVRILEYQDVLRLQISPNNSDPVDILKRRGNLLCHRSPDFVVDDDGVLFVDQIISQIVIRKGHQNVDSLFVFVGEPS